MANKNLRTLEDLIYYSKPEQLAENPEPQIPVPYRTRGDAAKAIMAQEAKSNEPIAGKSTVTVAPNKAPVYNNQEINVAGLTEEPTPAPTAPLPLARILPPSVNIPQPRPDVPEAPVTPETSVKKEVQGAETPSALARFLIGATPAVLGLLTGNPLEGVQAAGNYWSTSENDLNKRSLDFNQKIMEMKAKRDLASGKDKNANIQKTTIMENGKPVVYSMINGKLGERIGEAPPSSKMAPAKMQTLFDPATKTNKVYEVLQGQAPRELGQAEAKARLTWKKVFNPETKKEGYQALDNATGEKVGPIQGELSPESDMSGAQIREKGTMDRFNKQMEDKAFKLVSAPTSTYNVQKGHITNLVKAADLLNKPNALSDEGIKNFIARSVFDEKGPLSDSDLARLVANGALDATAARKVQRWRNGQNMLDSDAMAMRQVLESVYPILKARAMGDAEGIIKSYEARGFNVRGGIDPYVKDIPQLPTWAYPKRENVNVKTSVRNNFNRTHGPAPLSFEQWKAQQSKGK